MMVMVMIIGDESISSAEIISSRSQVENVASDGT